MVSGISMRGLHKKWVYGKRVLLLVIEHVNRFVRRFVDDDQTFLLLIDGHASRKGIKWLDEAREKY